MGLLDTVKVIAEPFKALSPVIPFATSALSFLGGERRNEAQMDATSAANAASLASTREQMNFQREMSNTAYQRAVSDMKAAGINPMLASRVGGASTPGGSAFSAQVPQLMDTLTPAIQSGIGAMTGYASAQEATHRLNLIDENIDNLKQQTTNLKSEDERIKATTTTLVNQAQQIIAQTSNIQEATKLLTQQIKKMKEETSLLNAENKAIQALDNLGRTTKQLQPAAELLINILKSVR